jgi:hypothetical protein
MFCAKRWVSYLQRDLDVGLDGLRERGAGLIEHGRDHDHRVAPALLHDGECAGEDDEGQARVEDEEAGLGESGQETEGCVEEEEPKADKLAHKASACICLEGVLFCLCGDEERIDQERCHKPGELVQECAQERDPRERSEKREGLQQRVHIDAPNPNHDLKSKRFIYSTMRSEVRRSTLCMTWHMERWHLFLGVFID